jgi:hypothetical protein
MKRARLVAGIIVVLEIYSLLLYALAALEVVDLGYGILWLLLDATLTVAFLVGAILLWDCRRSGWVTTFSLLTVAILYTAFDYLFVSGDPAATLTAGLWLILYGALLYLSNGSEVREACGVSRPPLLSVVIFAKVSLYSGALITSWILFGWAVAVTAVIVLIVLREWVRPHSAKSSASPHRQP